MDNLTVIGLGASRPLARAIFRTMSGAGCDEAREEWRPDGEPWAAAVRNVRGRDVFVVSSLHGDGERSVCDKTMQLLLFVDALKRASAARVTAVCPYLSFGRQDRKEGSREPVSTQALAKMMEAVGVDRVLTMDPHNPGALQNAFRIPIDLLEAKKPLADAILADVDEQRFYDWYCDGGSGEHPRRLAVVSPDAGGVKRAKAFQAALARRLPSTEVAFAHADKSRRTGSNVEVGTIVGDVAGTPCVVVDDMIGTASTLKGIASAICGAGGWPYAVAATHGLFVGAAAANLADAGRVFVADTVLREGPEMPALARSVSTVRVFADAIRLIHGEDGSISRLLED